MSAAHEYDLYDLEAVNDTLGAIFRPLLGEPVQINTIAVKDTNKTPRLDLVLRVEPNLNNRFPGARLSAGNSILVPLNTWSFTISATVVTNREVNGIARRDIIKKVRWQLQACNIIPAFTPALSPLYVVYDCREDSLDLAVDQQGDLDQQTLMFRGFFAIRNSAWPV